MAKRQHKIHVIKDGPVRVELEATQFYATYKLFVGDEFVAQTHEYTKNRLPEKKQIARYFAADARRRLA
jgi:hypothetical protein